MNQAYLWEKLGKRVQIALRDDCINEITLNPEGKLIPLNDIANNTSNIAAFVFHVINLATTSLS